MSKLITEETILGIINTILYNHDYLTKEMYLKCGSPSYISGLPGDLRSSDVYELGDRLDAIENEITNRESILQDADKRINRKLKDNERLGKRIEKSMDAMDTAMDKIADESDKIVKNITKSNFEEKIKNWTPNDDFTGDASYFTNNLLTSFNNFREAHNNFFKLDLTDVSMEDYDKAFEDYVEASKTFNSAVEIGYEEGVFTKGDVKNSDCSANMKRIDSNITKYKKNGESINNDVESAENNQKDIDYITNQSNGVNKEIDILLDEFERTHGKYTDKGGKKRPVPNPQMMIVDSAKEGGSFTFFPNGYDKYMV